MYDPSVFSLVMWIFIPSGTIGAISSSALKNCVLFVMSRESLRGVSPAVSSARADLHPAMRTGKMPFLLEEGNLRPRTGKQLEQLRHRPPLHLR